MFNNLRKHGHAAKPLWDRKIERCSVRLAIAIHLALLASCGGGGNSRNDSSSTSEPTLSNGSIDAVLSVPAPTDYDTDKLAAFNRLNQIRLSAGLGMLASNTALDEAAQSHIAWIMENGLFSHKEALGSPGFTGISWWDRDTFAGYSTTGGDEVMSYGLGAAGGVDALVNMLYHRQGILEISPVDVGIGYNAVGTDEIPTPLVIDMTSPADDVSRNFGQKAQQASAGIIIWPLDGATQLRTLMGNESPDPVPGVSVMLLGTPASITVEESQSIDVGSFTMTDSSTGSQVAAVVLTNSSDPNGLIPKWYAGVVPLGRLNQNTNYTVDFSGSISGRSGVYSRHWSFTTGEN